MNLMKIFNKNYFKENIRKSKGLLAFFFGVVPLINIIVMIVALSSNDVNILFDFNTISVVTFLGLYILPIVLAVSLFGFVFKQKSVDFVMSKPISRKAIYVTNIIGATLLMTLFMLINVGIFALFGMLFSRIVIPVALLFDYFVFWLISYIFMFSVATLAITLAGNFISSIVIVMIIVCLFPFLELTNTLFTDATLDSNTYYECSNQKCKPNNYLGDKQRENKNQYELHYKKIPKQNYTTPALILKGMDKSIYNTISLIKMVGLSLVYLSLGYVVFKKRKMENNEMSFKSEAMHYLVKTITLLPVSLICYVIIRYADVIGILITGVGILIYSIVYDFITRKEIYKLIKSTIISLLFCFVMVMAYSGYLKYYQHKVMVLKEIKDLSVLVYSLSYEDIVIKDEDLVQTIIRDTIENNYSYKDKTYAYIQFDSGVYSYYVSGYLSKEVISKITNYKKEEDKKLIQNFNYMGMDSFDDIPVTRKLKNIVKTAMLNYQGDSNKYYFVASDYRNHKYEEIKVPINASEELTDYVMKYKNKSAIDFLNKVSQEKELLIYVQNGDGYFDEESNNIFSYVINKNMSSFINYLQTQNKTIGDIIRINCYSGVNHENILIADSKDFEKEYEKYKNNLKNDSKYLELVSKYGVY